MKEAYGSPFAIESTHLVPGQRRGAEVTRHLWAVARQYRESFDVYGAVRSFEWAQTEDAQHVIYLGEAPMRVTVPDFAHLLPPEIQSFTRAGVYSGEGDSQHRSFVQGGGHGGSHPHLAHRLIQSVLGEVAAFPNAVQAANITCSGILPRSALREASGYPAEWTVRCRTVPRPTAAGYQPPWRDEGRRGSTRATSPVHQRETRKVANNHGTV